MKLKKILLIALILLLSLVPVYAEGNTDQGGDTGGSQSEGSGTGGFLAPEASGPGGIKHHQGGLVRLRAGYGRFMSVEIYPIVAESIGYGSGMPINLENSEAIDPSVNKEGDGIQIATWEMLSNDKDFEILVSPQPLRWVDPTTNQLSMAEKDRIDYTLTFQYQLTYTFNNKEEQFGITKFSVSSDGAGAVMGVTNPITPSTNIDQTCFLGTLNEVIWFKLTPDGAKKVGAAPDGDYRADVEIKVVQAI